MNMGEPFDVYTDSFAVTVNPWGANLNLFLSQAQPAALEGSRVHCVGIVRMSNEYLKVLAYMLSQRISEHETDNEVNYDVPSNVLQQLGIGQEDWDRFWERTGGVR